MVRGAGVAPRLLRIQQAANYLATSKWKLRSLAKDGIIPHIADGDGSPWRFDLLDLDVYIQAHKQTE
jgi:excisionase family DNA binding protein